MTIPEGWPLDISTMMMKRGFILLDFNNVFTGDLVSFTSNDIEAKLMVPIRKMLSDHVNINRIEIRIYGGWYQQGALTDKASTAFTLLSGIDCTIPLENNGRWVRWGMENVISAYGTNHFWNNTYRQKSGLPRIIVKTDAQRESCGIDKNHCPVEIVKKISKGAEKICQVEGCALKAGDIFQTFGQKMIDTLMACDILTIAEEPETDAIAVMTDDVDILPALVVSSMKYDRVGYYIATHNNQHVTQDFPPILNPYHIKALIL